MEGYNNNWVKIIPIAILLLALSLFFYFDLHRFMTFDALATHRQNLQEWVHAMPITSVLIFMAIYTIATAVSIPGAIILTITSGFLFGPIEGTLAVIISATLGAIIVFWAAKTAFAGFFSNKAGETIKKMQQGFAQNALSYLFFLRLVPIFPFWLVNVVPGLLNIRLKTFAIATFFGIIPGSFVYVLIGNGLGAILDQGKTPNLGIIFEPEILAPLIGLGLLALIPIIYQKFKKS